MIRCLLAVLVVLTSPTPSRAQEVREVIGATSDVYDVAVVDDRLLLATSGGLLARGARGDSSIPTGHGARTRSVSVTPDAVWVGGVDGAARLDRSTLAVTRAFPLRRVTRVAAFGGSTFIATYGSGLYLLSDPDGAPERVDLGSHHALSRVTDLAVHGGALWVATAGAGIVELSADGTIVARVRGGLPDPMVWSLVPDGDRLLVATLGGVAVIEHGAIVRRARETRAAARLPVRDVRDVARSGDTLWMATWGGGVYRLDGERSRAVRARGDEVAHARALLATEGGVIVAHDAGLARSDARGALRADGGSGLPSADVTSLARAFGSLWVGTFDRGLARIRDGRVEAQDRATERWGLDRRINDLAVTRERGRETLWIATDRGLYWHDGRRFSPAVGPGAPGREHVTSLHADGHGALWVTSSRELSRRRGGRWQSWTGDEHVPVMQLHAVTTDARGRVWVGSLHGLFRFDPATGSFERHTVSSGALPVDWVTAVAPFGDGVVAGTYHGGLSWYDGRAFRIEREGRAGIPAGWVNSHAMRWIGDTLLVGTLDRGLVIGRSGAWQRLRVDDGLPSDDVTDILPMDDGTAWVATRGGLALVAL